jgi:hypothetical protein
MRRPVCDGGHPLLGALGTTPATAGAAARKELLRPVVGWGPVDHAHELHSKFWVLRSQANGARSQCPAIQTPATGPQPYAACASRVEDTDLLGCQTAGQKTGQAVPIDGLPSVVARPDPFIHRRIFSPDCDTSGDELSRR